MRDDDSKICADLHVTLLNCSYSETNADVLKCANLKKLKEPIVSLVTNLNNKNNVCKKLSPVNVHNLRSGEILFRLTYKFLKRGKKDVHD